MRMPRGAAVEVTESAVAELLHSVTLEDWGNDSMIGRQDGSRRPADATS
jgi:hypothetical protein